MCWVEEAQTISKISIHAPAWGATSSGMAGCHGHGDFNPRSRMGSDAYQALVSAQGDIFQSTLPHGERLWRRRSSESPVIFQSTLPHGERPPSLDSMPATRLFQSTLPHGERQSSGRIISPVKISIHAPAWGATRQRHRRRHRTSHFNPRSRMGSDEHRHDAGADLSISIHAPAWHQFQSTLPRGIPSPRHDAGADPFQSTLPHGERLQQRTAYSAMWTISSVTANNVLLR